MSYEGPQGEAGLIGGPIDFMGSVGPAGYGPIPTQTLELLDAIISGASRYKDGMADGKLSFWEKIGFVSEWDEVKKAADGIGQIDNELLTLDDRGRILVNDRVTKILVLFGFSHRSGDFASEVLKGVLQLIRSYIVLKHLPPVALPVTEHDLTAP